MADVFIDGEPVVFEGAVPATAGELHELLAATLGARERVLAALVIDGDDYAESDAARPCAGMARIEARSLTTAEALGQLAGGARRELVALEGSLDELAGGVLRAAWPEVQPACVESLGRLARLLETTATLAAHAPPAGVAAALEQLAAEIDPCLRAVSLGDCAGFSLAIDEGVLPRLAELRRRLEEQFPPVAGAAS